MGLYVSIEDIESKLSSSISRLLDIIPGAIFLGVGERLYLFNHHNISLEVKKPTKTEQSSLWHSCLDNGSNVNNDEEISKLLSQFDLNASSILSVSKEAMVLSKNDNDMHNVLWNTIISRTHPKIAGLAQKIISNATMNDLMLPERENDLLKEIIIHVKQRMKVYEEWGFAQLGNRGLGITSLFAGPSGTGKTIGY